MGSCWSWSFRGHDILYLLGDFNFFTKKIKLRQKIIIKSLNKTMAFRA
jgi:calcineurin-like phosphoesterase family protein